MLRREWPTSFGSLLLSSVIRAISAVSIAAFDPTAPTAIAKTASCGRLLSFGWKQSFWCCEASECSPWPEHHNFMPFTYVDKVKWFSSRVGACPAHASMLAICGGRRCSRSLCSHIMHQTSLQNTTHLSVIVATRDAASGKSMLKVSVPRFDGIITQI